MTETDKSINSLILPLIEQSVLLPQVVVAEIVPTEEIEKIHHTPGWFRGFADWRGTRIPVASLESLCGREADTWRFAVKNFAVLHASMRDALLFYAIELRGIPRPIKIVPEGMAKGGVRDKNCDLITMNVIIEGQQLAMIDMNLLERRITQVLTGIN